jgi:hypothetical protein
MSTLARINAMFIYSANDVMSKCYFTSVISFLLNGFLTLLPSGLCDKQYNKKIQTTSILTTSLTETKFKTGIMENFKHKTRICIKYKTFLLDQWFNAHFKTKHISGLTRKINHYSTEP